MFMFMFYVYGYLQNLSKLGQLRQ